MEVLALKSSGIAVIYACVTRLVDDRAFDRLYPLAECFFKAIFYVHRLKPEVDLIPVWSTVLCAEFLEYVYNMEGWAHH